MPWTSPTADREDHSGPAGASMKKGEAAIWMGGRKDIIARLSPIHMIIGMDGDRLPGVPPGSLHGTVGDSPRWRSYL